MVACLYLSAVDGVCGAYRLTARKLNERYVYRAFAAGSDYAALVYGEHRADFA